MKWFDKWFAKKVKHAWDNANQLSVASDVYVKEPARIRPTHPNKGFVDFKLWFADNGGYIIEFSRYDERKDKYNNELFIIQDGIENLGNEITQILTQHVISNR